MRRNRLAVPLVIALLAGCGTPPGSVQSALSESLTFTSKTSTLVAGSYTRNGVGIVFSVDAATMSLSSSTHSPLIQYQTNGDGSNTVTFFGGSASVRGWVDSSGNDQEVDTGDVDGAIASVMSRSDLQIVPYLSVALSANGADGNAYPITMQLHSLAQKMSSGTGVDPTGGSDTTEYPPPMCTPDMAAAETQSVPAPTKGRAAMSAHRARPTPQDDCQDLRGDPNCNQCLGMCGPGCTCWSWVCGDCCSHRGCLLHDNHCRACDRNHKRDCVLCALFDFGRPLFTC